MVAGGAVVLAVVVDTRALQAECGRAAIRLHTLACASSWRLGLG